MKELLETLKKDNKELQKKLNLKVDELRKFKESESFDELEQSFLNEEIASLSGMILYNERIQEKLKKLGE